MKMETISEMLIVVNHMMRLSDWEYFVQFCCPTSLRMCKMKCL